MIPYNPEILIRKMGNTDRAIWVDMRLRLWSRLSRDEHLSDIEKMLRSKMNAGYIAFLANHQPVGFAETCIREYANGCTEQPVPFLEGIWVSPGYRRQGVGRAIINKITADLIRRGFHELCSDAEIRNRQSHKAHENWGFNETERVVYFRKQLT